MKHVVLPVVALLVAASLQPASAGKAEPGRELLQRLHVQLEQIHSSSMQRTPLNPQRPDLTPLGGVHRSQLASILGPPDFCATPDTDVCNQSRRWSYFFYRSQPPISRIVSPTTVEVMVPAGGGWAMEVTFSKQGVVEAASWVPQR